METEDTSSVEVRSITKQMYTTNYIRYRQPSRYICMVKCDNDDLRRSSTREKITGEITTTVEDIVESVLAESGIENNWTRTPG